LLGVAPVPGQACLEVAVEGARLGQGLLRGEHHLGGARRQFAAGSEEPACTSTGRPCGERGRFSGPRTR
jgi:hypothetical protein